MAAWMAKPARERAKVKARGWGWGWGWGWVRATALEAAHHQTRSSGRLSRHRPASSPQTGCLARRRPSARCCRRLAGGSGRWATAVGGVRPARRRLARCPAEQRLAGRRLRPIMRGAADSQVGSQAHRSGRGHHAVPAAAGHQRRHAAGAVGRAGGGLERGVAGQRQVQAGAVLVDGRDRCGAGARRKHVQLGRADGRRARTRMAGGAGRERASAAAAQGGGRRRARPERQGYQHSLPPGP